MGGLELWGGHECTVNRVGGNFRDQTALSGHHHRIEDLDRFAGLGISKLRYPVLWERVAPKAIDDLDFSWSDARLARISKLGMAPILGLLHHGSGPAYTNLLEPAFAAGLAMFARAVAERYPTVEDWTPVNEPLTTARFSCLYGHWYPHVANEEAFWRALLNQIDAVRLSMREIRAVNPRARLVQTEDFGRTYATGPVQYQADYDNTRRWMTWDLLGGMVVAGHPLWARLCDFGFEAQLQAIADDPCPPDVIGINHYLTSERFLDHDCEAYPPKLHGGNGRHAYVDVEAVRVMQPAPSGLEGVLREAAERYPGQPLAVTECHNGCTREEQMRWFAEAWDTAGRLCRDGLPIEAVTAWALLGAYDWDSLLTVARNSYEPGVFDLRSSEPRATAMTRLLPSLVKGGKRPRGSEGQGWWSRDIRLEHRPAKAAQPPAARCLWRGGAPFQPPLLITGATGTLGQALARACEHRGIDYVLTSRKQLDLADPAAVDAAMDHYRPWAVLNAAGWVRVDDAEEAAAACFAANAQGALELARACCKYDAAFVGFSSDLVFDGRSGRAYREDDEPNPLNAYGNSKAEAERLVLEEAEGRALLIRTAAFFSAYDEHNFAVQALRNLAAGRQVLAADDLVVSPTYVPDLVRMTLDLVLDEARGLWHLANEGQTSWADFARALADASQLDPSGVIGAPSSSFGWRAARPAYAPLVSRRGQLMPSLQNAIDRFAEASFGKRRHSGPAYQ